MRRVSALQRREEGERGERALGCHRALLPLWLVRGCRVVHSVIQKKREEVARFFFLAYVVFQPELTEQEKVAQLW